MKIGFSEDSSLSDANSGKHKFFIRLAKELKKKGHEVDNKNSDVFVTLPGKNAPSHAKIKVVRLDGLIMNTRWDYNAKNKKINNSIKKNDAVIYQGKFCKEAFERFLGVKNKRSVIIPNGASPEEFLPRDVKNYFLANCKWRPHKRLKAIVKSYLRALKKGLDSDLIVTGKVDYKYDHPRIKYVGWQKREELRKLLSGAIASIHLTWLDWCPNSMVEAIVAGCPVIYTKSGGHTELGEGSGIGINDTQWNFKLIDLYDPPPLSRDKVADALIATKNGEVELKKREDLYIENVCERYIKYFESLS